MTDPTYTPSDAHERESRRPRVITTAAELDALPTGSVVLDADGDSWQKKRTDRWAMVGIECLYSADHVFSDTTGNHPVTLLIPATEPETAPIRLTDPDDPRIRVGALVALDTAPHEGTWITYRYVLTDIGTVDYVRQNIRSGFGAWTLLAEAPDPEVILIADLTAILTAAGIPTAEAGDAAAKVRDRMRGES